MENTFTKIWVFIVLGIALVVSIFISFFLFIAILLIALITVPYLWYIQWKTKKELEKMDVEYKVVEIKKLEKEVKSEDVR